MILQEQMDVINWSDVLSPFLVIIILIILIGFMLFLYLKPFTYNYIIILIIFLFSLIIGIESMTYQYLPFNPYLSILFLLIQTIIFFISSLNIIKENIRG